MGEYAPVEVIPRPDIATGGVYQLRQVINFLKLFFFSFFPCRKFYSNDIYLISKVNDVILE